MLVLQAVAIQGVLWCMAGRGENRTGKFPHQPTPFPIFPARSCFSRENPKSGRKQEQGHGNRNGIGFAIFPTVFSVPTCYSGIPGFSRFPSRQQTADKYAGPQSSLYLTSVCSSEWMGEVGLNSGALLVHCGAAGLLAVGQGLLLSCACMHACGPRPASGSPEIHRSSLGHSFHFLFSFAVSLFCCSVPLH